MHNFRLIRFSTGSRNSTGGLHCKKFCIQVEICLPYHCKRWRLGVSEEICLVDSKERRSDVLFLLGDCTAAHATATKMTQEKNWSCSHSLLLVKGACCTSARKMHHSGCSLWTALLPYVVARPCPSFCHYWSSPINITGSREHGKWQSPF